MALPSSISVSFGEIVIVEFGPDPRSIAPPGIMNGPLGVLPEMFKQRHAIVIATTYGLTTVIPLSTKAPPTIRPYHLCIPAGKYGGMSTVCDSWTKSDLITTVSNLRIDRPFVAGKRVSVTLDAADKKAVRATVLHALQLSRLTPHL
jgi:uncharacterized protein YifN (PemK superfamily)